MKKHKQNRRENRIHELQITKYLSDPPSQGVRDTAEPREVESEKYRDEGIKTVLKVTAEPFPGFF